MRRADTADRERILQYLQKGLADCLYLYIDIVNYGIATENMQVWIEEQAEEISLVVMKYHDSFQIYSHEFLDNAANIRELLVKYPVSMVSGRKDIIEQLEKECKEYRASYGTVFIMDKYRELKSSKNVLIAAETDAEEIAELICSDDEIGGHYTVEDLSKQLAERIKTGTGRSYIIRENGVIVAHSATYAEAEGIAVVGGTIIHPQYRNGNHYMLLSNYMLQQLAGEGKTAYTFSLSEKMLRYHGMLHTKCGEYGKLVRIKKGNEKI